MTEAPGVVRTERDGASAVIVIDNPPVNAMSHAVRTGLKAALEATLTDGGVASVILIGAGRSFIAGADITEFGRPRPAPLTPDLIAIMEAADKPVIAAIHGYALGGGLELAMGCHYRMASEDARVGQPEVKLGILPGAGGTQRLPRLVGVPLALEMIAGGEPITASQALEAGLIDELVPPDRLRQAALAYAARLVRDGAPLKRVRDLPAPESDRAYVAQYRDTVERRRYGVVAPLRCIEAVEAASALPFDQGLAKEQELFQALVASDQAKAQRHLFFAEREAAKIPDLPADLVGPPVTRAAVVGAGTMGGGIAMCFANAGIPVTLVDATREALDRGLAAVRRNYEGSARRGLGADEIERRMALISPSLAYDDVGAADVVIEAVFEDLPLKQEVFRTLDRAASQGALLATNTSYQDVNAVAAATARPEQVLGMHFFSPANVMRLVEVVRGAATAKPALAQAMRLARRLGKVPVMVGVCYGFVGNRMLAQRSRAVERLLLEGALPQDVDAALTGFGFPMGPCAAGDLAGLDVGWRARKAAGTVSPIADLLCEAGRFGQKTGGGYYHYEAGSRAPLPDPAVERLILAEAARRSVARRAIGADEIVERAILPMVNEGARILEEGIALRASDIDVIWVYGYGFPTHRGGPMFFADTTGLATVAAQLEAQARRFDDPALAPSPLLRRLAAEGRGFVDRA